jgi:AbrB family looped-hinge helix DNA binding protein
VPRFGHNGNPRHGRPPDPSEHLGRVDVGETGAGEACPSAVPQLLTWWYSAAMSGTYTVTMGDRGRLVIPSELRERSGLKEGSPLVLLEAPGGLVLLTRAQLQERVRADLAGLDLVEELLAERSAEAATDDAA